MCEERADGLDAVRPSLVGSSWLPRRKNKRTSLWASTSVSVSMYSALKSNAKSPGFMTYGGCRLPGQLWRRWLPGHGPGRAVVWGRSAKGRSGCGAGVARGRERR